MWLKYLFSFAIVIAIAALLWTSQRPPTAAPGPADASSQRQRAEIDGPPRRGDDEADAMRHRIVALEARLAQESSKRAAIEEQIAALTEEISSLRAEGTPPGDGAAGSAESDTGEQLAAHQPDPVDYSKSPMQRALEAAGLDETTAEGIKLRGDQLAMTEMYLRDQATREGWLDTPRFKEEMEAIEAQRTSIRDDIGDDAYDRYLFALGRTNRVIVNDVMFDSVAEEVGLREGDLILSYGETRIFAPDELVASTQGGPLDETVQLQVSRGGQRMEIEVPRGPLGLRIGVAQDNPDS